MDSPEAGYVRATHASIMWALPTGASRQRASNTSLPYDTMNGMPRQAQVLAVLIASPGDVERQRGVIQREIED